jgi:Flp pilus assembly pilin Flp
MPTLLPRSNGRRRYDAVLVTPKGGEKAVLKLAAYVQMALGRFQLEREEGQTMAEYAVILSVITAAVLLALGLLSGNIQNVINRIADSIK